MSNIGCKIIKNFNRPDKTITDTLGKYPVSNIDDCMNRLSSVHRDIKPINDTKLFGTAFTVKVPEGDNLMFHKAMDMAKEGDVIVIDAGGSTHRAILGDLMANYCKVRGIAGVVVDGSVRDYEELSKMDFPVYARGITPRGPYKNGPGEINTTISFGGQMVSPGDIVIGDGDGLIFIPLEESEEILKKVKDVYKKEDEILNTIKKDGTYSRSWVDTQLEEIKCEYIKQ